MADSTESPRKTYRGNCHCGAFVYEAELPEITAVHECNCSVCQKKGYLWISVGPNDSFKVVKGDDDTLNNYTFGERKTIHKFCPDCGTAIMATHDTRTLLNVHAMQGVNTWDLKKNPYDGAAKGDPFQPPSHKGEMPEGKADDGKLYTGSCHCGTLTLAVHCEPLDETYKGRVVECNCSICERNAAIWIYLPKNQVVLAGPEESIGRYRFGSRVVAKFFCKNCGVNLTNGYAGLSEDEEAALGEKWRGALPWMKANEPVNVRVLDGVDLGRLTTKKADGFNNMGAMYENP